MCERPQNCIGFAFEGMGIAPTQSYIPHARPLGEYYEVAPVEKLEEAQAVGFVTAEPEPGVGQPVLLHMAVKDQSGEWSHHPYEEPVQPIPKIEKFIEERNDFMGEPVVAVLLRKND